MSPSSQQKCSKWLCCLVHIWKRCEIFSIKLLKERGCSCEKINLLRSFHWTQHTTVIIERAKIRFVPINCPTDSHKSEIDNNVKNVRLENEAIKNTQKSCIIEQWRNTWLTNSNAVQNGQIRFSSHPLWNKSSLVKILFCKTNYVKHLTFLGKCKSKIQSVETL
jgi:hypothetical protein